MATRCTPSTARPGGMGQARTHRAGATDQLLGLARVGRTELEHGSAPPHLLDQGVGGETAHGGGGGCDPDAGGDHSAGGALERRLIQQIDVVDHQQVMIGRTGRHRRRQLLQQSRHLGHRPTGPTIGPADRAQRRLRRPGDPHRPRPPVELGQHQRQCVWTVPTGARRPRSSRPRARSMVAVSPVRSTGPSEIGIGLWRPSRPSATVGEGAPELERARSATRSSSGRGGQRRAPSTEPISSEASCRSSSVPPTDNGSEAVADRGDVAPAADPSTMARPGGQSASSARLAGNPCSA